MHMVLGWRETALVLGVREMKAKRSKKKQKEAKRSKKKQKEHATGQANRRMGHEGKKKKGQWWVREKSSQ
eukprot:6184026-Pleurochrysis_carterae.AAC.1